MRDKQTRRAREEAADKLYDERMAKRKQAKKQRAMADRQAEVHALIFGPFKAWKQKAYENPVRKKQKKQQQEVEAGSTTSSKPKKGKKGGY